jgi:hypothetical protein
MEDPAIIWQKWQDEIIDELDSQEDNDDTFEDDLSDDDNHTSTNDISKQLVMLTPMGILPYNSANICLKNFNLWIGHTNFSISASIANIIESTDGVETLDVFTRYRFRIGIGKVFSDSSVMRLINNKLYDYINEYKYK